MNDAGLERLRLQQRWAAVTGVLLVLIGGLYLAYGVLSFEPAERPDGAGFDRPIARLGLLYRGSMHAIDQIRPETDTEAILLRALSENMTFSANVLVLLMRGFLSVLLVLAGLIALTVFVERERVLRLFRGTGPGPDGAPTPEVSADRARPS